VTGCRSRMNEGWKMRKMVPKREREKGRDSTDSTDDPQLRIHHERSMHSLESGSTINDHVLLSSILFRFLLFPPKRKIHFADSAPSFSDRCVIERSSARGGIEEARDFSRAILDRARAVSRSGPSDRREFRRGAFLGALAVRLTDCARSFCGP